MKFRVRGYEQALTAAVLVLLIAGATAILVRPPAPIVGAVAREEGSLLAPPSDSVFTDEWGSPVAPAATASDPAGLPAPDGPDPGPAPPLAPLPGPPEEPVAPPPDGEFLPDLPILPPLPPPPWPLVRATAGARAGRLV